MSSVEAAGSTTGAYGLDFRAGARWWSGPFLRGLLVVQIVVGFEFLWSVVAKLVRGGFVSGLGADLTQRVQAAPSWYASFAHNVVVPHAGSFAVLIIAAELFIGGVLIGGAIFWLARWGALSRGGRLTLTGLVALAALAALFMNLNFHIANGATDPWQIGASAFDEAVDINTVLAFIDAIILVVMIAVLASVRRAKE